MRFSLDVNSLCAIVLCQVNEGNQSTKNIIMETLVPGAGRNVLEYNRLD